MVRLVLIMAIAKDTCNVFSVVEKARDHQGRRLKDKHGDLCHDKHSW